MNIRAAFHRMENHQPSTWWGHGALCESVAFVAGLLIPWTYAAPVAAVAMAFIMWGREFANRQKHDLKSHDKVKWTVDGFGDFVFPAATAVRYVFGHARLVYMVAGLTLGALTMLWSLMGWHQDQSSPSSS